MTDSNAPLEVLGLDETGRALVVRDPSRPGSVFSLPLDDTVRAAVAGEMRAAGQLTLGLREPPSPREIQARLRAGESAQSIAESSGVALERIERWEGPVAGERAHLLERALASRVGESSTPLGDAVAAHLTELGADPHQVSWSAVREPDQDWVIRGERPGRTGRWSFQPGTRRLLALDGGAATLLEDPPPAPVPLRRPRAVPEPVPAPVEDEPTVDADETESGERPTLPGWDDIVAGSRSRSGRSVLDTLLDGSP